MSSDARYITTIRRTRQAQAMQLISRPPANPPTDPIPKSRVQVVRARANGGLHKPSTNQNSHRSCEIRCYNCSIQSSSYKHRHRNRDMLVAQNTQGPLTHALTQSGNAQASGSSGSGSGSRNHPLAGLFAGVAGPVPVKGIQGESSGSDSRIVAVGHHR